MTPPAERVRIAANSSSMSRPSASATQPRESAAATSMAPSSPRNRAAWMPTAPPASSDDAPALSCRAAPAVVLSPADTVTRPAEVAAEPLEIVTAPLIASDALPEVSETAPLAPPVDRRRWPRPWPHGCRWRGRRAPRARLSACARPPRAAHPRPRAHRGSEVVEVRRTRAPRRGIEGAAAGSGAGVRGALPAPFPGGGGALPHADGEDLRGPGGRRLGARAARRCRDLAGAAARRTTRQRLLSCSDDFAVCAGGERRATSRSSS